MQLAAPAADMGSDLKEVRDDVKELKRDANRDILYN